MSDAGAERGRLAFRHGRLALAVLSAVAALIALLAWLDQSRSQGELQRWRERLCGELPAELVKGLDALSRETSRAPAAALQALAVLKGLPREDANPYVEARILFESTHGWRELREWGSELGFSHDPALLASVRSWRCDATLENGTLRAVRPLRTSAGLVVLLVLERRRQ